MDLFPESVDKMDVIDVNKGSLTRIQRYLKDFQPLPVCVKCRDAHNVIS